VAAVTVDSPEKQRVGNIAQYHVAAAVVFELTQSGCDLSTAATPDHHG